MTILFVDGFDLSRDPPGTLVLGLHDFFGEWTGAVAFPGPPRYIEGYEHGQALKTYIEGSNTNGLAKNAITHTGLQYRIGAYVRGDRAQDDPANQVPTSWDTLITQSKGSHTIQLQMAGDMALRLRADLPDQATVLEERTASLPIMSRVGSVYTPRWVQVELAVNWATGQAEVFIDGVRAMNYASGFTSTPLSTANVSASIGAWGAGSSGYDIGYDHLYIAAGGPLSQAQRVIAVAPATSVQRVNGARETRSFLIMDGTQYNHSGPFRIGTAQDFSETRYYNQLINTFATDPRDNSDWSLAKLADIEEFGWCTTSAGSNVGTRYANMGLYVLEMVNGLPQVTVRSPSGVTRFNGPWQKSNDMLSYSAHVSDIPRQDPEVDDESLSIFAVGCIAFQIIDDEPGFGRLGLTFAEEFDPSHADWRSVTGGDNFDSYFITGYKLAGEGDKKHQSNYVTVNYEPQTNASAYFQGVWDYSNDPSTGRWGQRQQVMRNNDPRYNHNMSKLKVRGHGRVLQFRVSSEDGKPFRINGWTVLTTVGTSV